MSRGPISFKRILSIQRFIDISRQAFHQHILSTRFKGQVILFIEVIKIHSLEWRLTYNIGTEAPEITNKVLLRNDEQADTHKKKYAINKIIFFCIQNNSEGLVSKFTTRSLFKITEHSVIFCEAKTRSLSNLFIIPSFYHHSWLLSWLFFSWWIFLLWKRNHSDFLQIVVYIRLLCVNVYAFLSPD